MNTNKINNFLQNNILDQNFYQEIKQNHFKDSFIKNIKQFPAEGLFKKLKFKVFHF